MRYSNMHATDKCPAKSGRYEIREHGIADRERFKLQRTFHPGHKKLDVPWRTHALAALKSRDDIGADFTSEGVSTGTGENILSTGSFETHG